MNGPHRTARGEQGSLTLELAILAPAILLLIGLMIVAGRVQVAAGGIEHAAAVAARAASESRTPDHARSAATIAVTEDLTDQDIECPDLSVQVDTSGFAAPLGQPAVVTTTVTCRLLLTDLTIPGLDGRALTSTASSPLDQWRARP